MATLNEIENFLNIELADRRLRPGKMHPNINKYYYYENMYYIVELSRGKYMVCSDNRETRKLLRDYCWRVSTDGYAQTTFENTTKRYHQLYLQYEAGLVCDHINHTRYDNRYDNLRIVTRRQNDRNRKTPKNNVSGKQGVYRLNKISDPRWVSRITDNEGKTIQKSFSINKLGDDEAKRRAIQSRRDMEIQFGYTGE